MLDLVDDTSDIDEFEAEARDLDDDEHQKIADYIAYVKETCTFE